MCCRSTKAMLMAALLGAGPVVWSAPASAATADEIQAGLQDWFANALPQSRAGVTAQLDGTVSVTAAGSGFSAMLPPIRLSLGSHAHSALLIESVTVDLQPLLSGGYAANWSLPETIALQGPDGAQATITIAERSGHGLYSPDLALMVSTDFDLRDIQVAADGRAPHLALDSLAAGMRYDAVAPGVFDQSTELHIGGLSGLDPDGSQVLRIASIALSGGARGIDLAAWRDLGASLRGALGHRPKTSVAPPEPAGRPALGRAALLNSYQGNHRITDASFQFAGGPLSIGDGALDFSFDGLDSSASSLAIAFSLSDIDHPAAIGPLTPRAMAVDLEISGLPTDRLFDAVTTVAAGAGLAPSNSTLAMFGLYLQDTMMTSGARITINEVLLTGDDARLRLAGTVKPTHAAPLGAIADLEMSIAGLPGMLAAAQADPADGQTLQQLAVLQAVGTPGTDPDGTAVLQYGLEITQQGQILLNGANLLPALANAAP